MTTLEKIRAEIEQIIPSELPYGKNTPEHIRDMALSIIDKYAEQEPCENCDYSEIVDWEQDTKTGKAKPIYWCERHKEPCEDAISRQAVLDGIEELKRSPWCNDSRNGYEYLIAEALDVVKDLCIKKLPSVQPKPIEYEDAVSRQAALNLMRSFTRWCVRSQDGKFDNVGLLYDDVMFGIAKLPSVQPKPKTGRWIDVDGIWFKCSECGAHRKMFPNYKEYFCPNCGAKMESEDKE